MCTLEKPIRHSGTQPLRHFLRLLDLLFPHHSPHERFQLGFPFPNWMMLPAAPISTVHQGGGGRRARGR